MSATTNMWYRNQTEPPAEEELLVFGYSCKIFRDDEKATYIDQGKHLIPWMGDESIMIDRYDVRGYLHDLSAYEAKPYDIPLSDELAEEERLCDEERYLALTEEELYHEEELKRLRAAVASDGAYHQIGFTYENADNSEETQQSAVKDEEVEEPFIAPEGLNIPRTMPTPSNMKIHAIVEKTATFISQQGGQMEIIIKMKQGDNPQFAFMNFDNPLHPYYKHLIQEIKSGRYKPKPERKRKESDEHHDGHYLHPSLMSGKAEDVPKFTVPSINFLRTGNDSYSMLVKNLKECIAEDAKRNSPTVFGDDEDGGSKREQKGERSSGTSDSDESSTDSDEDEDERSSQHIVPPPPDMQTVIDKMAEYVAKNGTDFETIVKSKDDKRFEFLKPGHRYYKYYVFRRNSIRRPALQREAVKKSNPETAADNHSAAFTTDNENMADRGYVETSNSSDIESYRKHPAAEYNINEDTQIMDQTKIPALDIQEGMMIDAHPMNGTDSTDSTTADDVISKDDMTGEKEEAKPKQVTKVIKGPISFSLKAKENETQNLEKKIPLLLDDDDSECDEATDIISELEKKRQKLSAEAASNSRNRNVANEGEEKKKLSPDELEAKLAEEKRKDKLVAAARERLAQQKRGKQLQLERKQKAAMFLLLLKQKEETSESKKQPETADNLQQEGFSSPSITDITSPDKREQITCFPPSPGNTGSLNPTVGTEQPLWNSSSSSDSDDSLKRQLLSHHSSHHKEKKKKKKRSHSHDKHSHKHSKKRKRSSSKKHSKPKKSKKQKKLPAAYAMNSTRSRSRSPKRYGSRGRSRSPSYWSHRRL